MKVIFFFLVFSFCSLSYSQELYDFIDSSTTYLTSVRGNARIKVDNDILEYHYDNYKDVFYIKNNIVFKIVKKNNHIFNTEESIIKKFESLGFVKDNKIFLFKVYRKGDIRMVIETEPKDDTTFDITLTFEKKPIKI